MVVKKPDGSTEKTLLNNTKTAFLTRNQLSNEYWDIAQKWFNPLIDDILLRQNSAGRPIVIGINGAQGSGKSTLADFIVSVINSDTHRKAVAVSIDDYYLSKKSRQALGKEVHPLLTTRGAPGTHDTSLLKSNLTDLRNSTPCVLPVFQKHVDDLAPLSEWHQLNHAPDIIVLEGWCVGSKPLIEEHLEVAINTLEKENDRDGSWRAYQQAQLKHAYADAFKLIDFMIMLKAPSFECVLQWRIEQERKLVQKLSATEHAGTDMSGVMSEEEISDFIQYFQRLTEENLKTLPLYCNYVFVLDKHRKITACQKQK